MPAKSKPEADALGRCYAKQVAQLLQRLRCRRSVWAKSGRRYSADIV